MNLDACTQPHSPLQSGLVELLVSSMRQLCNRKKEQLIFVYNGKFMGGGGLTLA